ncbi:MAG: Asp-tRNA(Asn)/Glu-tRNA(Gln) amidotransferase subunit GatC [Bacilli bacterium]|nr:Asp-tRNA(Asn)/Glu-tRNA(Gln) amidotransferase subunit GatC [Bacilli bacterium]
MEFNQETIDKLSNLLLIGLTPEENKMILDEFKVIDENINKINNIKGIENAKPMTHALDDFVYELREDVAEESPSIEDLLSNCDQVNDREVEVPKVVE